MHQFAAYKDFAHTELGDRGKETEEFLRKYHAIALKSHEAGKLSEAERDAALKLPIALLRGNTQIAVRALVAWRFGADEIARPAHSPFFVFSHENTNFCLTCMDPCVASSPPGSAGVEKLIALWMIQGIRRPNPGKIKEGLGQHPIEAVVQYVTSVSKEILGESGLRLALIKPGSGDWRDPNIRTLYSIVRRKHFNSPPKDGTLEALDGDVVGYRSYVVTYNVAT